MFLTPFHFIVNIICYLRNAASSCEQPNLVTTPLRMYASYIELCFQNLEIKIKKFTYNKY